MTADRMYVLQISQVHRKRIKCVPPKHHIKFKNKKIKKLVVNAIMAFLGLQNARNISIYIKCALSSNYALRRITRQLLAIFGVSAKNQ
jgi:hypothetical protein